MKFGRNLFCFWLNLAFRVISFKRLLVISMFFKTAWQRAKKVLSDSPGLVDFAIGLVNSVFNLPDGQVIFYEEFE